MATAGFSAVKVFFATTQKAREELGEKVTAWLRERPQIEIVDRVVCQSSDNAFHGLSITLFYKEDRS